MKGFVKIVSQIVIMAFCVSADADLRIYNKSRHPVYFSFGNPRTHPATNNLTPVNARRGQKIASFPTSYTQLLLSRSPQPGRGSRLNAYTFSREYNPIIWVDVERDGSSIKPSKDAPEENVTVKDIVHGYVVVGKKPSDKEVINLFNAIANHDMKGVQAYVKRLYHLEVSLPEGSYAPPLHYYYKDGLTPLMAALDQKNYQIARYLIHNGANAHARTLSGKSGLDLASHAHVDMIRLLHQQEVSLKEDNLLRAIVKAGDLKALKYIEKHGTNPTSVPDLIHHAGSPEIVDHLLQLGLSINNKDDHGRTPLFYAIERENGDLIKALLAKGAESAIKDHENISPVDLARSLYKKRLLQSEREKAAVHRQALSLMVSSGRRFW